MTQTNDTPMRDDSRDGGGGCLVCGKPSLHVAHALAREPISTRLSACVINPACPICSAFARSSSAAARWRGADSLRVPQLR